MADDAQISWLDILRQAAEFSPPYNDAQQGSCIQPRISRSRITKLGSGNGVSIIRDIAIEIIEAQTEILFVTCFWAQSESQRALADAIQQLAAKAQKECRLVKVQICYSSSSMRQKLLHPASLRGKSYSDNHIHKKLGLPWPSSLIQTVGAAQHGVRLSAKSIFIRPMSVMHSKFVILDRRKVFLPSCNVSFENWFEGYVKLQGAIVKDFLGFYREIWDGKVREDVDEGSIDSTIQQHSLCRGVNSVSTAKDQTTGPSSARPATAGFDAHMILLPSWHHRNPHFRPTCLLSPPSPPLTPLNNCILALLEHAVHSVYIQTPNVTASPVIQGLLDCLCRGVTVTIVTNRRMMTLEQLYTAGTTTAISIRYLLSRYKKLCRQVANQSTDAEQLTPRPLGQLTIKYYQPLPQSPAASPCADPVKSHFKLSIIDEQVTVLGSGNMDRASWYTSQELGVAICSKAFASDTLLRIQSALRGMLGDDPHHMS